MLLSKRVSLVLVLSGLLVLATCAPKEAKGSDAKVDPVGSEKEKGGKPEEVDPMSPDKREAKNPDDAEEVVPSKEEGKGEKPGSGIGPAENPGDRGIGVGPAAIPGQRGRGNRDSEEEETQEELKPTCKAILEENPKAASGVYTLRSPSGQDFQAYCEMGLNGGGYTHLYPSALVVLTDEDIQAMFTDRSSFLLRLRQSNGQQPYVILEQLKRYKDVPLMLGLNQNVGYNNPVNLKFLDPVYLYYGFLSQTLARDASNKIQGFKANGKEVTFKNCDKNPNAQMSLFPNFSEKSPSPYGRGFSAFGTVCSRLEEAKQLNPSSRTMPGDIFMFMEQHWGGCGCYGSTDHRSTEILGSSIGFR